MGENSTGFEIAVIGMSGRFPGADNIEEFWNNLINGVESITFFSDGQLQKPNIGAGLVRNPDSVNAGGILHNKDSFDASFFEYSPKEVEIMDPQMRVLHECVWSALEDAGYSPGQYKGLIGLYAGASPHFYWEALSTLTGKVNDFGIFAAQQLFDKDFLTTQISYKLDLKGPSVTLYTACSTSLVAIHMACRALIGGECDLALAGGVSISSLDRSENSYQEGMIVSPDGHCRSFDAKAQGTVFGEGAGIIVLKPLENAIRDNDSIHAVIKSTAINNDGKRKVGYTAPSIQGQAEVIRAALELADADPESISYIEAHGTGTVLGDPIEVEALKLAFHTNKRGYCGIGSVKTNIGHLDAAAGVASVIKTILAMKHKIIPKNLHFETPNPKINFKESPFFVVKELKTWEEGAHPLRAGINSCGIGGTNAHLILEEAPQINDDTTGSRPYHILLLSAKTNTALGQSAENLANHLRKNPGLNLADIAYTLQTGREAFRYRRMMVCADIDEAVELLSSVKGKENSSLIKEDEKHAVFMFPGQGSQYINMGRELYDTEMVFRRELDRCFQILSQITGNDFKKILYPYADDAGSASDKINQTEYAQPLLFIFEYALARLLMSLGIWPKAMIGHSIGEFVAAHLSGVFSLEDAIKLTATRGKLMQQLPQGKMLSVQIEEKELRSLLHENLSLAAANSTSLHVVSGPEDDINLFHEQLKGKGYFCTPLHTSHAFHSKMMEPVLSEFEKVVRQVKFQAPHIPYLSNVSGDWITNEEAGSPEYWVKHIRETVQFAGGLERLLKDKKAIFLETGPGRALSIFAEQHKERDPGQKIINMVRHPKEGVSDGKYLLSKLGDAWLSGLSIDWAALYSEEKRKRLPLPTYPFEKRSYKIKGDLFKLGIDGISQQKKLTKNPNIADWFYVPSWKRTIAACRIDKVEAASSRFNKRQDGASPQSSCQPSIQHNWLIFTDETGLGSQIIKRLKAQNQHVTMVKAGAEFSKTDGQEYIAAQESFGLLEASPTCGTDILPAEKTFPDSYSINPQQDNDYDRLFECLRREGRLPGKIIHLWTISDDSGNDGKDYTPELADEYNTLGFYSLLHIARAIGRMSSTDSIEIKVVTNHLQEVTEHDLLSPCKATVLGPVKVIPREFPDIHCSCIDIEWPGPGGNNASRMVEILVRELESETPDTIIAYRGSHRWVQIFEPVRLAKPGEADIRLKDRGVYLITGGLGGIGLVLAEYLARTKKARLILTGRSFFPARNEWDEWLKSHDQEDKTGIRIRKVQELEKLGAEVLVFSADVSDKLRMQQVITGAKENFGGIDGVIHAAGTPDSGVIQLRSREKSEEVFSSKITGLLILDALLRENSISLDFFLLCSSLASILPPFGQVAYCAANSFLDTYACFKLSQGGPPAISLNWDAWQEVGMAFESMKDLSSKGYSLEKGILPSEGVEAFRYALESALSNVAVSTADLKLRIEQMHTMEEEKSMLLEAFEEDSSSVNYLPRPELTTEYMAPGSEVEQRLARMWKDYLGFEEIGIHDNFFELGGNSLKAVMIISKIHAELNSEPPLAIFFDNPTIQALAEYIENSQRKMYQGIEPVEKREYYPQSSAQKRLFIINQFDNVGLAYNLFLVKKIEGTFSKERFERAIEALIERHEILRTSFAMIHDEPVQIIHDRVDCEVRYYELDENEMTQERMRELSRDFYRPFDLSRAPLFRIACARMAPDPEFYFILQMHHIITDGSSGNILYHDLMRFYRGEKPKPLHIQYKDFVCWQNSLIEKGQFKEQEEYWTGLFSGGIPRLDLPLDFPRPDFFIYRGESHTFMLDKNTASQLKDLCVKHEATLFMTLLATLNILFHKYTGMEDIVIGSVVAGRRYHPELQDLTGFFINVLAMRNYPGAEKTFLEFLKDVRKNSISAYENQEFQFEELIDRLDIERDPSRNPLFDVCFVVQNYQDRSAPMLLQPNEMKVLSLFKEHVEGTTLFDLDIEASESGDQIQVDIKYCASLFRRETIERLAGHWLNVMNQVCSRPDMRIADVELLSEHEKRTILFDFNRTEVKYPENKTICDLFEEQVDRSPEKVAVICNDYSITYRELDEKSSQVAHYFHEAIRISAESRIGILMDKSIEVIIAILGIWKAGCAYVPLDPSLPEERIRDIIDDAGICHILSQEKYLHALNQLQEQCPSMKAFLCLDWPDTCLTSAIRKGTDLKSVPFLSGLDQSDAGLRQSETGLLQRYGKERLNLAIPPEHLAYVIYTSGSTGKPKGVMVEHRQYVNAAYAWRDVYRLRSQESEVNLLQIAAISFDVFAGDLAKALVNGGKLILCPEDLCLDFEGMYALIKNHQVSLFESTPALIIPFMDYVYTSGLNIESLKLLILGSDTCNAEDFRTLILRFGDRMRIINSYGVTEATIDTSCYEEPPGRLSENIAEAPSWRLLKRLEAASTLSYGLAIRQDAGTLPQSGSVPIGRPLPNMTCYILDEHEKLQPIGVPGELYIGGAGVSRGYVSSEDLTKERFKRNPYIEGERVYKTGDLAKWLPGGTLAFLGRSDYQVKIRGYRIEPGEIESKLKGHSGIKEAVVIAGEDNCGDKYLCAYVVAVDRVIEAQELEEHLSQSLPRYMIPSFFIQVKKIPLTPHGKVDRKALPLPERASGQKYLGPRDSIEERLVEIWSEILRKEKDLISVDANFFHLGGHSLKATILASGIHQVFEIKVPLNIIFKYPTIEEIARYLKGKEKEHYLAIKPADQKEYYPLSSAQKRLYILQQFEENSTSYNIPLIFPLAEDMDKERLEDILKKLIARHESLRTSFEIIDDEPVQKIHHEVPFSIEYCETDESDLDTIRSSLTRAFDLSRAPLVRAVYVKMTSSSRAAGFIDMHHIITDAASNQILIREIKALYEGRELPQLRLQYKDFSEWQHSREQQEQIRQQELYWLEIFSVAACRIANPCDKVEAASSRFNKRQDGASTIFSDKLLSGRNDDHHPDEIPVLNLPTDYPRPPVQSFEGSTVGFLLTEKETLMLKGAARETETTLFMVILSLYTILLSKLSGQEDIIVGTPIAGRRHADLEGMVGMFVNTLALRNYPHGEKSLAGFIAEVKERTLKAFENQEYQFEDLVDKLNIPREISRNPLFDVMLNVVNPAENQAENQTESQEDMLKGNEQDFFRHKKSTAKFDLTLTALETGKRLYFQCEYSTRLFHPATIERFISSFRQLIQAMGKGMQQRLSELEILSDRERHKLLYDFNQTKSSYSKDKTIQELFEAQVEMTPDSIAVSCGDKSITYAELNKRANQLARLLREKGIGRDSIAGILMNRSIEVVIGILGIVKAGGCYLPIDPEYPQERMLYMLEDSKARILLTQDAFRSKVTFHGEMINGEDEKIYAGNSSNLENINRPDDLVYVIYTSGSTGKPKGVMICHKGLVNYIEWAKKVYVREDSPGACRIANPYDKAEAASIRFNKRQDGASTIFSDRLPAFPLYSSLSFDLTVTSIFTPLISGNRIIVYEDDKKDLLITRVIEENKAGIVKVTPTHLNLIKEGHYGKSGIRRLIIGGEDLKTELARQVYTAFDGNIEIYNEYGPTEATVGCMIYKFDFENDTRTSVPIGVPADNVRLYIVDKYLNPLPIGVAGELCIGGDGLARGYLYRPELTAEKFIPNPFIQGERIYKTGDLARWLPAGRMEFLGRMDHQVKIRGFRIEPGEIESHLLTHEAVQEVVVLAQEADDGHSYLCAWLVSERELTTDELRRHLSGSLPDYMIPSYFIRLEAFPFTANGKIDRRALLEMGKNSGLGTSAAYQPPRNPIEKQLVEIWEKVLRREHIGINDNFFMIGGDSIRIIQIISRLSTCGYKLSVRDVFLHPTIAGLAPLVKPVERIAEQGPVAGHLPLTPNGFTYNKLPIEIVSHLQELYEIKDIYTLAPLQEGMLFHALYDKTSPAYFEQFSYRLEVRLEISLVERSLQELSRRHDVLRTVFLYENMDRPIQLVLKDRAPEFLFEDIRNRGGEEEKETFIRDFKARDKERLFDLSKGPLIRMSVLQLSEARHEVIWSFHHILMDGWCTGVLLAEFFRIYQSLVENRPYALPEAPPYSRYIAWLENQDREQSRKYWSDYLSLYDEATGIPKSKNNQKHGGDYRHGYHAFTLGEERTRRLSRLSGRLKVTLNTIIRTVWGVLLAKYNSKTDVVFGAVVSGRPSEIEGIESMVGLFINAIPVRIQYDESMQFDTLLQQVQERAIESEPYHYYPLAEMQANSELKQNLFDHLVVFENYPLGELIENLPLIAAQKSFGRLEAGPTGSTGVPPVQSGRTFPDNYKVTRGEVFEQTNYDFNILVSPGSSLAMEFKYNANLFQADFVQSIAGHLLHVIDRIIENEKVTMKALTILSEEEKNRILHEFNHTDFSYPKDKTIQELFEEQVERTPEKVALGACRIANPYDKVEAASSRFNKRQDGASTIFSDRLPVDSCPEKFFPQAGCLHHRWGRLPAGQNFSGQLYAGQQYEGKQLTYRELNERANQLARVLREKHIGTDSVVGIMVDRSLEMVIGMMGVLKAGGAYVPIDPAYPQERIRFMCEDSRTALILTQRKYIDQLKGEYQAIEPGAQETKNSRHMGNIIDLEDPTLYQGSTRNLEIRNSSADLAYIIYTSGTTGRPKGVMIEHRSLVNLCFWHNSYYEVSPEDNSTQYAGFGFDASVLEIFPYLIKGATLYIIPEAIKLDMAALNNYYQDHRITIGFLPTSIAEQFMRLENRSLRKLLTGGDKLRTFIKRSYELYDNYGPTENTVVSTSCRIEEGKDNLPIGKPVSNCQVYILEKDTLHLQPIGVVGEICLSGEGLSRGYVNRPDLTAEKFIDHPYREGQRLYRTGDLGRWLPDGNIEFIGRIDNQVKIRGFRIELGEIETHMLKIPEIKEAVVLAKEAHDGYRYLCAYFASEKEPADQELRTHLQKSLPDYMIPSYFIRLEQLPLTPNGKIDHKALLEVNEDTSTGAVYQPPGNEVEKKLAGIWEKVLERKNISLNDNFFLIGGHSLKAMNVHYLIRKELKVNLPLKELFIDPTIKGLAQYIVAHTPQGYKKRMQEIPSSMELNEEPYLLLNKLTINKIFCFPPITGYGTIYTGMASLIENCSIYAFNYLQNEGNVIQHYIDCILDIQPQGPYVFLGYSAGGNIAFEIAKELEKMGHVVSDIILLDSYKKKKTKTPSKRSLKKFEETIRDVIADRGVAFEPYRHMVVEKAKQFKVYFSSIDNSGVVNANLHLLAANGQKNYRNGWENSTSKEYKVYRAYGKHWDILDPGFRENNREIIQGLINTIFTPMS